MVEQAGTGTTELVTLSKQEVSRLAEMETIVERGQQTFIEVGNALATIKREKLYKDSYGTFKDYCNGRWGWTPQHTNSVIKCSEFVRMLKSETTVSVLPTSERQIRPLTALKTSDEQYEAWRKANEIADDENKPVTGELVKKVVAKMREKESDIKINKDANTIVAVSNAEKAIGWVNEINLSKSGAKDALELVVSHCNKLIGEIK